MQDSHILPEFVYKPIYDENHKGYLINPLSPDARSPRKFQKGLREKMLCRDCEQFLNDAYEKPFKELWFDRRLLKPLETSNHRFLQCGEYARFKLFHLSVLLRAELATRGEFREVSLGERHRARLLEMVRNQDAGAVHEYPIVCPAIRRPDDGRIWWDLVSSPNHCRVYGMRAYQFTFGGCGWMYFVSSHREPNIEMIALGADGRLPVIKRPWGALKKFAPCAKPQGELPSRG